METISSGQTFLMKRIFPAFWLAIVSAGLIVSLVVSFRRHADVPPPALFMFALMFVIGFLVFRKLLWDLADEVRDGGDFLIVRRGGIEERIPLSNVVNVSMSQFTNPKRLSLRLRTPCKLGDEIVFIPRMPGIQFNPFARNPVAEDLIRRVDRARQQDARR